MLNEFVRNNCKVREVQAFQMLMACGPYFTVTVTNKIPVKSHTHYKLQ